jgi:hypothetical protein
MRRTLIDFGSKRVRTDGQTALKVTRASSQRLQMDELWARSGDPLHFVWLT